MGAHASAESLWSRWRRRAVTVPATLLVTALATALSPLALPLVLLVDLARRRRLALSRAALMLLVFAWCETLGIAAAFALWLLYGGWAGLAGARFIGANARLQALWGHALFASGRRLFGMQLSVEGELPAPGGAPLLVLVRHASTVDTVLPVELLAYGLGWRLRYVLKRELLIDPCLDIVGHRLPNVFVRRQSGQTDSEAARVVALAGDMTARDALVIFPEGTRFTPRKREASLAHLRERGATAALALGEALTHTLSPLRAGPLALLGARSDADIVVMAHAGLEAAGSLAALGNGALIGLALRVRLFHVRAADVPRDADGRARMVAELWRKVDDFAAGRAAS